MRKEVLTGIISAFVGILFTVIVMQSSALSSNVTEDIKSNQKGLADAKESIAKAKISIKESNTLITNASDNIKNLEKSVITAKKNTQENKEILLIIKRNQEFYVDEVRKIQEERKLIRSIVIDQEVIGGDS